MAKYWKKRFSIDAPQLRVRPHLPLYLRLTLGGAAIVAILLLVWWAYHIGQQESGLDREQVIAELETLRKQTQTLSTENTLLEAQVAELESQIKIEQASSQELMSQVKALNADKIGLQEDLAFFQNLTLSSDKLAKFAIHRAKLVADQMPNEYWLRMLLVRSGERINEFSGYYQLILTIEENGQVVTHFLQDDVTKREKFSIKFKYYQRVDAAVHLKEGQLLKQVQVRVYGAKGGKPIATQLVTLS